MRLGFAEDDRRRYVAALSRANDLSGDEVAHLTQEAASVLAEWRHYAILELVRLDSFRAGSRWIARVLGIGVDEVNVAIQRLARLGLPRMEGARWIDATGNRTASLGQFTRATVERLAEEVRQLAPGSDSRYRQTCSITVALNREQLGHF